MNVKRIYLLAVALFMCVAVLASGRARADGRGPTVRHVPSSSTHINRYYYQHRSPTYYRDDRGSYHGGYRGSRQYVYRSSPRTTYRSYRYCEPPVYTYRRYYPRHSFYITGSIPPVTVVSVHDREVAGPAPRVYVSGEDRIIDQLMEGNDGDRLKAARELGRYQGADAVAALVDALINDSDAQVRREAALSLGEIGDGAALAALVRSALAENDADVQQAAEEAAQTVGGEDLTETFVQAQSYWPMNDGQVELGRYLQDLRFGNRREREDAADKLDDFRGTQAAAALVNALINDSEQDVREEAAQSLGELRDPLAAPFLRWAAQRDPAHDVRKDAEKALEKVQDLP